MYSKLRFPLGIVYPIALILTYIFVLIEVMVIGKPFFSIIFFGTFFIVVGALQFIRYRMVVYLILGILVGTSTWHSLNYFVFQNKMPISNLIHILIIVLFIIVFWPRLSAQERLYAYSRRLFSYASYLIEDVGGGYTDRPYSGGKVEISESDLKGFISFMEGKFIARAYKQEDIYYLGFSMGPSPLVINDPLEISHVRIDPKNNLSVSISSFDYRQYKESLNFDQLCQSMSDVFLRFIEYYKEGKESRIISELKSKK